MAAGGVVAVVLAGWAVFRVTYLDAYRIDGLSADLLTLAGFAGIATLVFGVWICWRRVGFTVFRIVSVVFGAIGVFTWPWLDYLSG